jgi:hypothetical protein
MVALVVALVVARRTSARSLSLSSADAVAM